VNADHVFRLILILVLVAILPVGVYHRLKAATAEKLDRKQEGLFLLVSIRLLGLVGMVGLLAFMIDPTWMAWASVPLPIWLRWAGVALGVLGASLLTWTFRNLGKNITDTVVTRKEHSLVTTGPYRWVRHPFYVSFALLVLATSLVTANWFILVTLSVVLLLLVIRTNKEEDNLIERFGDEYRNYMERTGRFWPRLVRRERKEP
jgi:protein-S-isoprenylcysteine O-methyltransferase Ste14